MTGATSTLEPAMTAEYVKMLVAANLRAITGKEAGTCPDYPGVAIEALISDEIDALEELPSGHGTGAELLFVGYCVDFIVDATVSALHRSPAAAIAEIRGQAAELKATLRDVLVTAKKDASNG